MKLYVIPMLNTIGRRPALQSHSWRDSVGDGDGDGDVMMKMRMAIIYVVDARGCGRCDDVSG